MRQPRPWYWSARSGWFVQVDRKQVPLGKAPKKTDSPPPDVMREYHRVMLASGKVDAGDRARAKVPEVLETFLAVKASMRTKTQVKYAWFLTRFARRHLAKPMASIRAADVLDFCETGDREAGRRTGWGPGTRHTIFQMMGTVLRWAREAGYVEFNPLAGMANPYPRGRRERGIELDEFRRLIEATHDDEFRLVLRFLRDTGCRPGELCVLTAAHLHPTDPYAKLRPEEHKTGGRTGRPKVLILPGSICTELRALAKQRPTGALLRTSRTRVPWTVQNIQQRFARLRKRAGLRAEVVPYASRHAFLTRLLEMGVEAPIAARIAGHSNTDILMTTYFHPAMENMIRAVDEAERSLTGGDT